LVNPRSVSFVVYTEDEQVAKPAFILDVFAWIVPSEVAWRFRFPIEVKNPLDRIAPELYCSGLLDLYPNSTLIMTALKVPRMPTKSDMVPVIS
jgi:hypothetical protein